MGASDTQPSAIERFGLRMAKIVENVMPSPFLFAIILSYLVFLAGILVEGNGPVEMVNFWYDGFWAFLTFAMQMTLILMTGFVIAYHPRVNDLIVKLASVPNSGKSAAALVGAFAMAVAWLHWGLSLILGAIFAREMGKAAHERGIDVHYPILCVAGYMGLGLTWHWGLSGSAPLQINTPGNAFIEQGILDGVVGTSLTIFSPYALLLTLASVLFGSAMLYLLAPTGEAAKGITNYVDESELFDAAADGGADAAPSEPDEQVSDIVESDTIADRLNNSRILGGIIALTGVLMIGSKLVAGGLDAWTLNLVNFMFLFGGLLIYLRPQHYREKFGEAAGAAAGIILLFPFFAGIQGMMNASGLSQSLADALFAVSTPETFPIVAWLTAGVVNVFVPSGGGEWIVLGPSVIEAANNLGVPVGQATIAYAVGDAHTNLLNPFWALPLLAITGVKAREMFGYAIAMLLLLVPFLAVALTVIPY
ncbi:short-chain fatty acid transporter [Haloparvum sedimenti]|uniref:short-chain fatty acid transporter n=1 Tax=Haloparvum sedimenti TaxID=1678448 RepID=UPI00071E9728|nr:TIGR00366 family protein [Haloparvum sedimenti]